MPEAGGGCNPPPLPLIIQGPATNIVNGAEDVIKRVFTVGQMLGHPVLGSNLGIY